MYDANENNMWPQPHQQQFMGPIPHRHHHHTCLQSPSPSSSSSASSSLHQFDAYANQRLDNHVAPQRHPHRHHGVMELPMPSNPRASRNMAEKQRRDNLNANISTMASLLPVVAGSARRMDKISILRLAAAFLRSQYTLGPEPTEQFFPHQFDFDVEQYIIDNMIANTGFFIVVTAPGKIVYVSRSIENQLGHAQHELLGHSLYDFICPDDSDELKRNLAPEGLQNYSLSTDNCFATTDDNSNSSDEPGPSRSDLHFAEQRRSFYVRMSQKALNKREHGQYEYIHISGHLRLATALTSPEMNCNRPAHREINIAGNDLVFVGIARMLKRRTITQLSLLEATKDEYVTRHLVDGRIIFCDHRISVVAGYMTEEVSGLSAFKFMHKEDVRWTMIALRQMYDRGEGFGTSCYRLLSKTGQFIYLRTHGYLEFDKDTQTVESFVCINTLVAEAEGTKLVREMKDRFAAIISDPATAMIASSCASLLTAPDFKMTDQKAAVEDPDQLEDAITHLIKDLPSPSILEERLSPSPLPDNQYYKAAIYSQGLPPASIQANKIGLKSTDCKSPPANQEPSENADKIEDGRRDSVLNDQLPGHTGRLGDDSDVGTVAGPSFAGNSGEEMEFLANDENRGRSDVENEDFVTGDETLDDKCEEHLIYGKNSSAVRQNLVNVVPPVYKPTNNNLQEKRNPRKRTSANDEEKDRRYGEKIAGGKSVSDFHRIEPRLTPSCGIIRIRGKKTKSAGKDIAVNNGTRFQNNSRKRSRSNEEYPGAASISKRKAVGIATPSNHNSASNGQRSINDRMIYYGNSLDTVNIARFIGPLSRTDELAGEDGSCLMNVADIEEQQAAAAVGLSIDDLRQEEEEEEEEEVGEISRLDSMDVYRRFNPARFLQSSNSVQQIEEDNHDDDDDDDDDDGLGEDLLEGMRSPSLDAEPDFAKTIKDLESVMCNGKTIDEANVNQFIASDQAVNEGIRRSQFQLEKSIALRESQLSVLKRDLDNPALQAQRENFTQLQAEHNKQKQMLKTLQQDHLTLQANVQHNVGV